MVTSETFPCIGAKTAMFSGSIVFAFYNTIASEEAVRLTCEDLKNFGEEMVQYKIEKGLEFLREYQLKKEKVPEKIQENCKVWNRIRNRVQGSDFVSFVCCFAKGQSRKNR